MGIFTGALVHEYVDKERLEALRRLSGGNINHFALELEKDVYAGQPEELAVKVENRFRTSTRVDFIREVSNSSKLRKITTYIET